MTTTAEAINTAFASNAKLKKRIFDAINETPQHAPLFEEIAQYHLSSQRFSIVNGKDDAGNEHPTKKRKLEDGAAAANAVQADQPRTVILEARDISFSIPQRKKLHLSIVQYGNGLNAPSTTFALCARNPATSQVEFEYPVTGFAYALRVAVPEKAQKQYNFCLLPSQAQTASGSTGVNESMIWTVNHGPLKSYQIHSEELKALVGTENILENALDVVLQHAGNKLIYPTEAEFASALVESHRKNDKAYHVKAFRGSKDGYLFFLENGIFFGFKKPLAFFPFDHIESLSYTAVLQRTFNLVIVVRAPDDNEEQEIEFSMIDQADFAGIDAYIRRHQLQDASMAEARRAKQFKVNGSKGNVTEGENEDGQTELQKAEQELEDEEDEMEEDYDPENEEDTEGSGSSDDEDYEYEKPGKAKNMVKDELGSEAEDVEITDDEDAAADEDEDEDDEDDEAVDEVVVEKPPITQKPVATQPATFIPISHHNGPDIDDEDQL